MKTLIASALVATAALTGAASAATPTAASAQNQIERAVPNADLTGLTTAQIIAVAQAMDNVQGSANKAAKAKALINTLH